MAGFFAGLVDGIVAGKNIKEGREDRARLRKMQDEEFGWKREDQNWQNEDRDFTRSERRRAAKERDAESAAWNETADELYGPQGDEAATPVRTGTTAPTDASPRVKPEDMVTTDGGLGFSVRDALTVSTKEEPPREDVMPVTQDPAKTDPTAKAPPRRPAGLGAVGAGASGKGDYTADVVNARQGEYAVGYGRDQIDPGLASEASIGRGQSRKERGVDGPVEMTLADAIRSVGEDAVGYRQGQVDPPLAREAGIGRGSPAPEFPPQRKPEMVGPVGGRPEVAGSMPAAPREMSILEQSAERNMPQASRERLNRTEPDPPKATPLLAMIEKGPAKPAPVAQSGRARPAVPPQDVGPVAGAGRAGSRDPKGNGFTGDFVGPRVAADGPQLPPRAEDASLPPSQPPRAPAAPAPQQQARDVPATPAGTPMESLSALKMSSEGLSFGIVGKDGPIKTTEARVARVTEQTAKAYERDHVPAIVEHYVRTGQLDKAKAFEQWIDDKGVKEGMKSWLGAIHSFQVGDGEGFLNKLADAYESANYYDDGLTMVREESNLTYDERGNIVGAQVTFKDEATGETFTQNVSDARDLVASAIGLMAPEKAFELAYNQTFGVKADTADRMTMGDAVDAINEEANGRMGDQAMTLEEKAAMYDAYRPGDPNNPFRAVGTPSGSLGNVPVYR